MWRVGCVAYTLNQTGWESTVIVPGDNGTIYPARVYGVTPEQSGANARLIAAAPDLLEACKSALRDLDPYTRPEQGRAALHKLSAAIDKAEGK